MIVRFYDAIKNYLMSDNLMIGLNCWG